MIQPLRTAHRRAIAVLALAGPLVFGAGLWARRRVVPFFPAASVHGRTVVLYSSRLWHHHPIRTLVTEDGGAWCVQLFPERAVPAPDLLLYWTADLDAPLPAATLLGSLEPGRAYALPGKRGVLLLYSLGHRATVDSAALEGSP